MIRQNVFLANAATSSELRLQSSISSGIFRLVFLYRERVGWTYLAGRDWDSTTCIARQAERVCPLSDQQLPISDRVGGGRPYARQSTGPYILGTISQKAIAHVFSPHTRGTKHDDIILTVMLFERHCVG